jgi:capsular polysaccharide transport system permease protein
MTTKRTSWEINKAVIFALLMREMRTRFGEYRLGYLWALLEPAMHIAVFALLFGYVMQRTMPGIDYTLFLVSGIIPWLLFNSILSRGMSAVSANRGLFGYRQVKPMDAFITRAILEWLIYSSTYIVFLCLAAWFGLEVAIENPLSLIAALLLLFLFSSGLALMLCVLVTQFPEVQKFLPLILRPLYFMSGIFFALETVPHEYRPYLLWNPILHANELSRVAMFKSFETAGASWVYLASSAVLTLTFGMMLYRQNSIKLVAT